MAADRTFCHIAYLLYSLWLFKGGYVQFEQPSFFIVVITSLRHRRQGAQNYIFNSIPTSGVGANIPFTVLYT